MIQIEKEPKEFQHLPAEDCTFCKTPTRYWFASGVAPVCFSCSKSHTEQELLEIINKPQARIGNHKSPFGIGG